MYPWTLSFSVLMKKMYMSGYFPWDVTNSYQIFEVSVLYFYRRGTRINAEGLFFYLQFYRKSIAYYDFTPLCVFVNMIPPRHNSFYEWKKHVEPLRWAKQTTSQPYYFSSEPSALNPHSNWNVLLTLEFFLIQIFCL